MAGIIDTTLTEEKTKSFDLRAPQPLDTRSVISSISQLDVELPLNVRYAGLQVYDNESQRLYVFRGGVDSTSLKKLLNIDDITINEAIPLATDATSYIWQHNLSSATIQLSCFLNDEQIPVKFNFLPGGDINRNDQVILDFDAYFAETAAAEIPAGLRVIVSY